MLMCVLKLSHEHHKQLVCVCVCRWSLCVQKFSRDSFLLILSIVSPVSVVVAVHDSLVEVYRGIGAELSRGCERSMASEDQ